MPDVLTILGGVVVGWLLKTTADRWSWRRQQVLTAYLELLDAVDRFGPLAGRVWASRTTDIGQTVQDVARDAEVALQGLVAIDRANGKLVLVGGARGSSLGFDLYVACEVMFRRAVAIPPSPAAHYHDASMQMVQAYHDLVNEGRREMGLRHWWERLPGRVSRFEVMSRRLAELNRTDPYPDATNPSKQSP